MYWPLFLHYYHWSLIRLSNPSHRQYSLCYSVHSHLNNAWYSKTRSLITETHFPTIASNEKIDNEEWNCHCWSFSERNQPFYLMDRSMHSKVNEEKRRCHLLAYYWMYSSWSARVCYLSELSRTSGSVIYLICKRLTNKIIIQRIIFCRPCISSLPRNCFTGNSNIL